MLHSSRVHAQDFSNDSLPQWFTFSLLINYTNLFLFVQTEEDRIILSAFFMSSKAAGNIFCMHCAVLFAIINDFLLNFVVV